MREHVCMFVCLCECVCINQQYDHVVELGSISTIVIELIGES